MDNLVVAISWHVYYPISFLKIEKPSTVRGRCDEPDNRSNIQYLPSDLKMFDKHKFRGVRIGFCTEKYVYFFKAYIISYKR